MSKNYFNNPMTKEEFYVSIALNRTVIFDINYITLKGNKHAYFATSAHKFNQPKTDWSQGGQAQNSLCFGPVKNFFLKWDKCHLRDMTDEEYNQMRNDLDILLKVYPYHILRVRETKDIELYYIPFCMKKKLSMEIPYNFSYKKYMENI